MKLKAIVETNEAGLFSVYLEDVKGVYGTGKSDSEAKKALLDAIECYNEHCLEIGEESNIIKDFTIEYFYDLSAFLKKYDIFDLEALGKKIGKAGSLLRNYKAGKKASEKQKKAIINAILAICDDIKAVKF